MSTSRAREALGFATQLYGERARSAYGAYVHRDPFSRLHFRPGRDDPYLLYEQIRGRGPFLTTRLGNLATVDHAICSEVLRSRRFGVRPEGDSEPDPIFDSSFLDQNPPDHTRLRRLTVPAFSPRRIAGYEPTIAATVHGLLDVAESQGSFDLMAAFAAPLPIAVITDLLGIPDADAEAFTAYGRVIGAALGGIHSLGQVRRLVAAKQALERVFDSVLQLRRREPADDLISHLLAEEGEAIRPAELVPLCTLLLIAGFETTVNLIGNSVNALLDHPDQWALLVEDPARSDAVVQEVLRFDPPVQRTMRISFDDTEVAGQRVRRGQFVNVLIGGANRDPKVFTDPSTFDIGRSDTADHLAFSSGIHHCAGRPLAELEARVALAALAERLPKLRRAGVLRRREGTLLRGPLVFPVAVG